MNNHRKPPEFDPIAIGHDDLQYFADDIALAAALDRPEVRALVVAVAEYCAEIGDAYTDEDGCCGNEIRAHFGLV